MDAEAIGQGITRLAHKAAWRMLQQAARDLRDGLKAERAKPRKLVQPSRAQVGCTNVAS
jgi:hypothetical protein